MRSIPLKIRNELAADPYYKMCCMRNEECWGKIEWHHTIIIAGRQLNEEWAILPLCLTHHKKIKTDLKTKKLAEKIAISRKK